MKKLKSERVKDAVSSAKGPAWKGPEVDGVTQSMLSMFLTCKERFRIRVIEGLGLVDQFVEAIEYGQMWHLCEEKHAEGVDWKQPLGDYANELLLKYPESTSSIKKLFRCCKIQFPIYAKYWQEHDDVKNRESIYSEMSFKVPYRLPSGRCVFLRGKFDSVDYIKEGRRKLIYLQENKAKGRIDVDKTQQQLTFDLQSMMYLTAMQQLHPDEAIGGIRYNVIRRPLSGGLHAIRQHKGRLVNAKDKNGKVIKTADGTPKKVRKGVETDKQFYERLGKLMEDNSDDFFYRWKVKISRDDLAHYQDNFLNPCLEHVACWYEHATGQEVSVDPKFWVHYRHPYGVYNRVNEGMLNPIDSYLNDGTMVGLTRQPLFRELDDAESNSTKDQ